MENYFFERIQPLSKQDIEKIHSATVGVLTHTGVHVESETARDLLTDHGCRADGEIIKMTEKLIEDSLKDPISEFKVRAVDPKNDVIMGGDNFALAPSGGAVFINTIDGIQRAPTIEEFHESSKLVECLDVIKINRQYLYNPPRGTPALEGVLSLMKYTNKVFQVGINSYQMLQIIFGVDEKKMNDDAEKGIYYALGGVNPVSPLELNAQQTNNLFFQAEHNLPIAVSPMPIGGVSAPASLAGVVLLQNCENLATMILAKLKNPRTALIYGAIGIVGNMVSGTAPTGTPEARVIELAGAQMARYYNLPSRGDVCLNDTLKINYQTGVESALQFYNAVRAGIHYLPGLGDMASWSQGSKEKLLLDAELAEYVLRIMRPLEINDTTLAVDLIDEVGPRGNYITNKHTLKNFRKEFTTPVLFQRVNYDKWDREGRVELNELATRRVQKLLDEYVEPDRDPQVMKDLESYVKANS